MAGNFVTIERADTIVNIPEHELRRGDVVLLQAGDLVPADVQLIEADGLEVDDWELTGELVPTARRVGEEDAVIYRGSRITRGHGKGLVIATGEETEYAKILKPSRERAGQTPLIFIKGKYLIPLVLLLPPVVMALRQGSRPVEVFLLAVLAAVVIILLQNDALFAHALTSVAARQLTQRHIRLRDTAALNIIGEVDIVCLDKTGVLTTREIEVRRVHFADGTAAGAATAPADERATLMGIGCALCNDVFFFEKLDQANPVDKALIAFAARNGYAIDDLARRYQRIYDQPFDSEARYMAAGFQQNDRQLYFVKGDPEVVLKMCRSQLTATGREQEIDPRFYDFIRTRLDAITQAGGIAIALACASGAAETPPRRYAFLGLIELENPLRPGVPEIVERLKQAGVRTIMLTGDRPESAAEVGRQARLEANPRLQLTGRQIARMSVADVAWQAAYVSIFARLLPSQKGVLVRLFQRGHHRVAMVGDGANDALALRAADVGISFVEDSSPIAAKASQVLINDLADLLTLIGSARRIKRWARSLRLFRLALLLALFLSAYYLAATP